MGAVKFYSEQEKEELKPFLNGELPVTEKNLAKFCKKYKRTFGAVGVYIYTTRKHGDKKTPAVKPKRTLIPYSETEKAELRAIAESQGPVNRQVLNNFCNKYKRPFYSAQIHIYRMRREMGESKKQKPKAVTTMLRKNEFLIPITNWEIRRDGDVTNLVLKF